MAEETTPPPSPARPQEPAPAPAPAPASAAAPSPPRRRRALAWAAGAVAGVLVLAIAFVGGLLWAVHSPTGMAWLLSIAPRITVTAPKGALIGDFSAARIDIALSPSSTLRLDAPAWRGLALTSGDRGRWLRIVIASLHADRATLLSGPATTPSKPASPPVSLRLPIELEIGTATVGELRIGGADAAPVRDLRARVHLGADGGALHRLDQLAATYGDAHATGAATIGADAPLQVSAAFDVGADVTPPVQAHLGANGPLAALQVAVAARVPATQAHAAQALDASALVHPFAAWPLGELLATTEALDLSALIASAPATSLSGKAIVASSGVDRPAQISIALNNARPGRWNEQRLPVQSLTAELRARPDDPNVLDVQAFSAVLGAPQRDGGKLSAQGRWAHGKVDVELTLDHVRPAALDARAPETSLDGKVTLSGTGFAGADPAARAVDVVARIAGQLRDPAAPTAPPRTARLALDAHATPLQIDVRSAEARLGDASATLVGKLARTSESAPWRAAGRLAVAAFDPAPWWPGGQLPKGTTRLNGKGTFDIALPTTAPDASAYDTLAATRGSADFTLTDSLLAGTALGGSATYRNDDGRARPSLQIVAAGNHVSASGELGAKGGTNDAWHVAVDAPRLGDLAPLVALFAAQSSAQSSERTSARASAPALAGTLSADARLTGRWPDLRSDGELHAAALRYGDLRVGRAEGRWHLGSAAGAPLEGTLALDDVSESGRTIERVRATLDGTAKMHRAEIRVVSEALPPAWVDALARTAGAANPAAAAAAAAEASVASGSSASDAAAASSVARVAKVATSAASAPAVAASGVIAASTSSLPPAGRSTLVLRAEGGLVDARGTQSAGWKGRLIELTAASVAPPARTWLRAKDVAASVLWGGGPLQISIEPGNAQALGATLRWRRIAYAGATRAGAGATLDVQATIDPIPVAPILAEVEPDIGWRGDLAVGARIDVHSTPAIGVDIVVERARGDLAVATESASQPLGLSDLRLGLTGRDGVYSATLALAGRTLGVGSGAVTARTGNASAWPDAKTPIDGVVELRIADLAPLATWLPAGWRVAGQLHASAKIDGRLGAPEYTGHVEGRQLAARNFLQGVSITGGDLALALQGETARIEHFTANAGKGTLTISGDAQFGDAPTARLSVKASDFELLGRVDRRIVASGDATLRLDAKTIGLTGAFKVDEGLIDFTRSDAPTLGDDVEVVRRPKDAAAPPPIAAGDASAGAGAAPAGRALDLDLRVDMGSLLRIRGRGIDAGLRGELHLTSPDGKLAVAGSLSAVDGTYQAYGQKLSINRSVITFVGPIENPRLNIEATRPDLDVRVGVLVTGTALNPRIRLFSDPDMSDVDKLSWLVLGKASTSNGSTETALLQRAALALLSGEEPSTTDRVTKALGLDEFSVRAGEGGTKDAIVSVGKQISKRWYVGYERGLNATTGSWELIYRIAQRFSVKAQAGGDNAVDFNWTLRWK